MKTKHTEIVKIYDLNSTNGIMHTFPVTVDIENGQDIDSIFDAVNDAAWKKIDSNHKWKNRHWRLTFLVSN